MVLKLLMTGNESWPITFGNLTWNMHPNSIKFSLHVISWPFQSIRNKLSINMALDPAEMVYYIFLQFCLLLIHYYIYLDWM